MNPTYIFLIFGGLVMFAIAAIAVAIILRRDPIQGLSNNANAVATSNQALVYTASNNGVYYADTRRPTAAGNNCNQPAPAGNINNFYFSATPGDNRPADAEAKPPAPGPDAIR